MRAIALSLALLRFLQGLAMSGSKALARRSAGSFDWQSSGAVPRDICESQQCPQCSNAGESREPHFGAFWSS